MRKANPAFCDRSKSHKKLDPFDDRKMVHWLAENPFLVRSSAISVRMCPPLCMRHAARAMRACVSACVSAGAHSGLRRCAVPTLDKCVAAWSVKKINAL